MKIIIGILLFASSLQASTFEYRYSSDYDFKSGAYRGGLSMVFDFTGAVSNGGVMDHWAGSDGVYSLDSSCKECGASFWASFNGGAIQFWSFYVVDPIHALTWQSSYECISPCGDQVDWVTSDKGTALAYHNQGFGWAMPQIMDASVPEPSTILLIPIAALILGLMIGMLEWMKRKGWL